MIIRIAERRRGKGAPKGGRPGFQRLAKYICEEREGNRILEGRIAGSGRGTLAPDLDLWDEFVLVTEGRHQWFLAERKGQDPTMHLVVSFTPEESDSLQDEDYWKIERQVLDGIGLESHHRISVVHDDTGNRHMHIAVDLLDERGRCRDPWQSKWRLKECRRKICSERGWEFLDGSRRDGPDLPDGAAKAEVHNNLESFTSWLRAEVVPDLKDLVNGEEALTWAAMHERLGRSGVELRKRGTGLVFSHRTENLFVKASVVRREFSLKTMEARLGSFEPAREGEGSADPDKVYRPKPRSFAKLWHRYREEMSQRKAMREERRLAAMASWRERRRKLTEFRKSTRSRLFGLLRGKCGIEDRVRHRAALVLTDRQVAEQREKHRDDYRREVGDARRHGPGRGGWSG